MPYKGHLAEEKKLVMDDSEPESLDTDREESGSEEQENRQDDSTVDLMGGCAIGHRVKASRSVLALILDEEFVFAGLQGGDIVVSATTLMDTGLSFPMFPHRFISPSASWIVVDIHIHLLLKDMWMGLLD